MRYAIYKLTFIVAIMFTSLVSCKIDNSDNFNYGYYVGITSFNKEKKVSFINQYDNEGNETNKIKFSIEGMSYLGDFIPEDDNAFYVKSSNIVSSNGKNYLIKVDKYTNGYSKIDLDFEDIYKVFVYDNKIYITHSFNKLSVYDNILGRITNTIELDNYIVGEFYVDEENVYVFSRKDKKNSYLNVLNRKTFEILVKFDITNFGLYQNDLFFSEGKLYFTNYDVNSDYSMGKIGIYDINTKTFDYINTKSNNLDKIIVYDDIIYVTVRGDNLNVDKDSIIRVNRKTKTGSKFEFDYNIKVFDIFEDKIFILSDKYLEVYNADNFELYKKLELNMEPNSVVSGIIIYDY